jgi:hypothetical protein
MFPFPFFLPSSFYALPTGSQAELKENNANDIFLHGNA